jgi:hypothetical protein
MNKSYSTEQISSDGYCWVRDLQESDSAFPGPIDVLRMDEEDVETLAEYLANDDGTLTSQVLAFSRGVAFELRDLLR